MMDPDPERAQGKQRGRCPRLIKEMANRSLIVYCAVLSLTACDTASNTQRHQNSKEQLIAAEAFIDAFYSFDSDTLRKQLVSAAESVPEILFYQGWAEGGNYEIIERTPCVFDDKGLVSCSITVKDDLMGALGIDYNVTDTFHLNFSAGKIVAVTTSSDDLDAYYTAHAWVEKHRPEVFTGPCKGFFDGGPTPGDCVRAIVKGYSDFVASGGLSRNAESPD